jgi:SAM-dependent methyltransferase
MTKVPYNADFYKEHPLTCDPDDLWGQVRRTVQGRPVSEEQIQLIVDAIKAGLELRTDDVLLDLCCGNGALTDRLFDLCSGGLGVDFSPPLIEVANRRFARNPDRKYVLSAVDAWLDDQAPSDRYTVALCYGSFSYLSVPAVETVLSQVRARFPRVRAMYLGNLPDKEQLERLVGSRPWTPGDEDRHDTQFGCMRTAAEVRALASVYGWQASIHRMPDHFYASGARFDAILVRPEGT